MTLYTFIGTACLLASVTSASGELLWGVNGHPLTAYPGITVAQQFDYMSDLGIKSYRVNIPDESRADELAVLVEEGKTRGIDILPVITPGDLDLDTDTSDVLYRKARELAVALGSRFKDDIRVWELGNEMENYAIIQPCEMRDDGTQYPCEWGPAGGVDALEYFGPRWAKVSAVLKGLSDGMAYVDPKIRRAIGTAGWGHIGAFDRLKQDGVDWDISVWHTYGQDLEWALRTIVEYGKPIWVTEFNNPLGSQRGDQQQADGLTHAMARMRELQDTYGVEAAHIYELMDEPYWAPDSEAFMGLVRVVADDDGGWIAGEPKPAYFAVRKIIRRPNPSASPKRDCDLSQTAAPPSSPIRKAIYAHCLMIGRSGDREDIGSWGAAIEDDGLPVSEMLLKMLRSDEFGDRHATFGLTNETYVGFLYRLLLGRKADPGGLDAYVGELESGSMTRPSIAAGIIASSEFMDRHPTLFGDDAIASPAPVSR
ncbi:DUF4214 domain-containing protein [Aurantimonas sp. A2-1-M11]|uniref:DUF4214 domain-containing protein n=1 Tax=Aurantimonas sp. A2-1-M11 TaxID=3113712 RepID=UPI002F91E465